MGIFGVVVVLDEVELDVVLGTHLTKASGASSNASISPFACGVVVEDHLELVSL